MKTPICERLGCEVPIFAFTHCRDVVVEVTKAGGFGVLGAVTHSPEQLERELKWIDEHVGGRPYGVDVLIPVVYDREAEASTEEVIDLIPAEQRQFVDKLLDAEGVPPLSADDAAEAKWVPVAALAGMEGEFFEDHFNILNHFLNLAN